MHTTAIRRRRASASAHPKAASAASDPSNATTKCRCPLGWCLGVCVGCVVLVSSTTLTLLQVVARHEGLRSRFVDDAPDECGTFAQGAPVWVGAAWLV